MAGFGQQSGLATTKRDDWHSTGYGPRTDGRSPKGEGGMDTAYSNYEGISKGGIRTFGDYVRGQTDYVVMAVDPKNIGKFYNIPELTALVDGKMVTKYDVKAYGADLGGAIKGDYRVDIPVDWNAGQLAMQSVTSKNFKLEQISPEEFAAAVKGADDLVSDIVNISPDMPTLNSMDIGGVRDIFGPGSQKSWNSPPQEFGQQFAGRGGDVTPGATPTGGLTAVSGGPAGLTSAGLADGGAFSDFGPTGFGSPNLKGVNNFAAMPQQQQLSARAQEVQSAIANALPQDVQDKLGISSGYRGFEVKGPDGRTITYNEKVGGAQHSAHLDGDAVDIVGPKDALAQAIAAARENAISKGLGMGVGTYKDGSIHIDYGVNRKGLEVWNDHLFTGAMKQAITAPVEKLRSMYDPLARPPTDLTTPPGLVPTAPYSKPATAALTEDQLSAPQVQPGYPATAYDPLANPTQLAPQAGLTEADLSAPQVQPGYPTLQRYDPLANPTQLAPQAGLTEADLSAPQVGGALPQDPFAGLPMPQQFGTPPELPPAMMQQIARDLGNITPEQYNAISALNPGAITPEDEWQAANEISPPAGNAITPAAGYDALAAYQGQLAPQAGLTEADLSMPQEQPAPPGVFGAPAPGMAAEALRYDPVASYFNSPQAPPPVSAAMPGLPQTPYAPAAPSTTTPQSPAPGMMAGGGYPMPTPRPEAQQLASAASLPESFGRQNMPIDVSAMVAQQALEQQAAEAVKRGTMPAAITTGVLGAGLGAWNNMQNAPGMLAGGAIQLGNMIAKGFGNIPSVPGAEIAAMPAQGGWIDPGPLARDTIGITPEKIHATIGSQIPPGTGAMINQAINSGLNAGKSYFGQQISNASQTLANGLNALPAAPSPELQQAARTADELIGIPAAPAPPTAPVTMAQAPLSASEIDDLQQSAFGQPGLAKPDVTPSAPKGSDMDPTGIGDQPDIRPEDAIGAKMQSPSAYAPVDFGGNGLVADIVKDTVTPDTPPPGEETKPVGGPSVLDLAKNPGALPTGLDQPTVTEVKETDPVVAPAGGTRAVTAPPVEQKTFGQPGVAPRQLAVGGQPAKDAEIATVAAPTGAWNAPWQKTTLPQDTPGALMSLGPMTPLGYEFAPEIAAMAATAGLLGGGKYFQGYTPTMPSVPSVSQAVGSLFSGGFGGFGQQQAPNTQYASNSAFTDFFGGFGNWGGGGGNFGPGGNPSNSVGVNEPGFGNQGRLDPNDPGMTGTGYY